MTITFDHSIVTELSTQDAQDRLKMITFNGTNFTNVYTAHETDFDYFRDDADVGDIIYFGWMWEKWHDLKLNITTPLDATSITIVWEYLSSESGWITLSVVDNSNAFQNSGEQVIEFTPPLDWRYNRITTGLVIDMVYGSFIRARITEVSGITEGGANGIIEPDGKDYTIQMTGTETLRTLYDYNVTNTLELITNIGRTFIFYCNFRIGDKAKTLTNLTMLDEILQIGESDQTSSLIKSYSKKFSMFTQSATDTWNMGTDTGNGCSFIYNCSGYQKSPYNYFWCIINWKNSFFKKDYGGYGEGGMKSGLKNFTNCIFAPWHVFFLVLVTEGSGFKNCSIDVGTGFWYIYTPNFSFDNINIINGAGILAQGCTLTNTNYGDLVFNCYSRSNYLIDCTVNDIDTQMTGRGTGKGYLQYTTVVNVIDQNGIALTANVVIKNIFGDVIYNGDSSTDVILTIFQRIWGGVPDPDTTSFNPFSITVSKYGYQKYTTTQVIEGTTNLTIALKRPSINIDNEVIC